MFVSQTSPLIDCWTFSIKRSFGPVICIPAGHFGEWKRSIGESLCTFNVSLTYPYNTSSQGIKYHIWILLVAFQNENKISGTMSDLLANKRTLSL